MCTLRLLGIQFFFEQLLKRKGKKQHNYVQHSSTRSSFSSTQRLSFHTIQVSLKMCNDNSGLFENAQPQFGSLWNVQQWFWVSLKMCHNDFGYLWNGREKLSFSTRSKTKPNCSFNPNSSVANSYSLWEAAGNGAQMPYIFLGNGAQILQQILRKWGTNSS